MPPHSIRHVRNRGGSDLRPMQMGDHVARYLAELYEPARGLIGTQDAFGDSFKETMDALGPIKAKQASPDWAAKGGDEALKQLLAMPSDLKNAAHMGLGWMNSDKTPVERASDIGMLGGAMTKETGDLAATTLADPRATFEHTPLDALSLLLGAGTAYAGAKGAQKFSKWNRRRKAAALDRDLPQDFDVGAAASDMPPPPGPRPFNPDPRAALFDAPPNRGRGGFDEQFGPGAYDELSTRDRLPSESDIDDLGLDPHEGRGEALDVNDELRDRMGVDANQPSIDEPPTWMDEIPPPNDDPTSKAAELLKNDRIGFRPDGYDGPNAAERDMLKAMPSGDSGPVRGSHAPPTDPRFTSEKLWESLDDSGRPTANPKNRDLGDDRLRDRKPTRPPRGPSTKPQGSGRYGKPDAQDARRAAAELIRRKMGGFVDFE